MFDCGGYRVTYIDGERERFSRFEESSPRSSVASDNRFGSSRWRFVNPFRSLMDSGYSFRSFSLSLPFVNSRSRNYTNTPKKTPKMLDPSSRLLLRINRFFVTLVIVSVAVDPLMLYLPVINNDVNCIGIDRRLAVVSTVVRTIIDLLYLPRILLKFRTSYSTSTRVGAGELITDPALVARRYMRSYFLMDIFAVLPIPQIMIWRFLNSSVGTKVLTTKRALFLMVVIPYFPRIFRLYPLMTDLKSTVGVFIETAWAGAAYYLLWFMLAGHNVGTFWYLLSLMREDDCWHEICHRTSGCSTRYLYCGNEHLSGYDTWRNMAYQVQTQCNSTNFQYGIFTNAIDKNITSSRNFVTKGSFCFWWGFQNLSTLGQGLATSTFTGEVIFSIFICVLGLLLFALLIGNMQTYLQSLSIRLEEMRVKKRDAEQWMHHRLLPPPLRERVRRFEHYRWLETRGVDEEGLVQTLPKDLRRDIKRHLTLDLVKRVPLFADMDDRLLDAVCERLKPSLYTKSNYILKEGEPVEEMLFIVRGSLESITTDGGRTGFFNRGLLEEGAFCGEELLTWALDPKSSSNFPTSTRTVRSLNEVEAFALGADDLKFVASQFRRLHSRQVQHTFRYHSQHWRTWAACFIQAAWRRYWRRKMASIRKKEETRGARPSLGATIYASRFAANAMRGVHNFRNRGGGSGTSASTIVRLQKPPEPDFSVDSVN
ncbi:putative cyclic nucleotide-gated ion channel 6 [Carex rostrata]